MGQHWWGLGVCPPRRTPGPSQCSMCLLLQFLDGSTCFALQVTSGEGSGAEHGCAGNLSARSCACSNCDHTPRVLFAPSLLHHLPKQPRHTFTQPLRCRPRATPCFISIKSMVETSDAGRKRKLGDQTAEVEAGDTITWCSVEAGTAAELGDEIDQGGTQFQLEYYHQTFGEEEKVLAGGSWLCPGWLAGGRAVAGRAGPTGALHGAQSSPALPRASSLQRLRPGLQIQGYEGLSINIWMSTRTYHAWCAPTPPSCGMLFDRPHCAHLAPAPPRGSASAAHTTARCLPAQGGCQLRQEAAQGRRSA